MDLVSDLLRWLWLAFRTRQSTQTVNLFFLSRLFDWCVCDAVTLRRRVPRQQLALITLPVSST